MDSTKYRLKEDETGNGFKHPDGKPCTKLSFEKDPNNAKLYPCIPEAWLWMPKWLRNTIAHITVALFCLSFLSLPLSLFLFIPALWRNFPIFCSIWLCSIILSYILPLKESVAMRALPQLWYELFDFRHNLTRHDIQNMVHEADWRQLILCMYPHGIIPLQALLWAAYCDHYMRAPIKFNNKVITADNYTDAIERDEKSGDIIHNTDGITCINGRSWSESRKNTKCLYGFGAAADVVGYLPFLRNIMGWYTAGSASYKYLLEGLRDGKFDCANRNNGRIPKNLYILPGGIAEIYYSTPKKHIIVMKKRYGLIRLALETGAHLTPCYVFGGTDFFNNFATYGKDGNKYDGSIVARLAKTASKFRMGLTFWWGKWGLPFVPFKPKVSLVIARPIYVEKWKGNPRKIDQDVVEELHKVYMERMKQLFDMYKGVAGYPNAELEIR